MVEDYHCAASHLHFLKMRSHATARCGLGHSLTETINTLPVKHLGMTAYVAPKPVCKAGFRINGAFTDVMVCHVHYYPQSQWSKSTTVTSSPKDSVEFFLFQRLSVQQPQPLGDCFALKGDCTACLVVSSLSSNNHSVTWPGCNHSQTNW